jgi:hypothetical protein
MILFFDAVSNFMVQKKAYSKKLDILPSKWAPFCQVGSSTCRLVLNPLEQLVHNTTICKWLKISVVLQNILDPRSLPVKT